MLAKDYDRILGKQQKIQKRTKVKLRTLWMETNKKKKKSMKKKFGPKKIDWSTERKKNMKNTKKV